jgi:hypothetical protein
MKELMAKIEGLFETLWSANLEQNAPKSDEDWQKFANPANELLAAGKRMLEPPLARDQGKWQEETGKLLALTGVAAQAIQEKNLTLLNDTTNKMTEDTCASCHKLYLPQAPPQ